MRLLPLMLASILTFSGCSAGGGLQATPPAPIPATADSTAYAPSTKAGSDAAVEDVTDASPQPPASESVTEGSVPTGAGGRFLLI